MSTLIGPCNKSKAITFGRQSLPRSQRCIMVVTYTHTYFALSAHAFIFIVFQLLYPFVVRACTYFSMYLSLFSPIAIVIVTMNDRSSSTASGEGEGLGSGNFWSKIRSTSSATLGGRGSSFSRWLRQRKTWRRNSNSQTRNKASSGRLSSSQRSPWMRRSRRIPREYEEEGSNLLQHKRRMKTPRNITTGHTPGTMVLRPCTSSRPLADDDPYLSFSGISPWDRSLYEESTLEHSVLHDLNMTYVRRR